MTPQSSAIVVLALSSSKPRTKLSLLAREAHVLGCRAASSIGESRRQWLWRTVPSKLPPPPLNWHRPIEVFKNPPAVRPFGYAHGGAPLTDRRQNHSPRRRSRHPMTAAPQQSGTPEQAQHFSAALHGAPYCEPARVGHAATTSPLPVDRSARQRHHESQLGVQGVEPPRAGSKGARQHPWPGAGRSACKPKHQTRSKHLQDTPLYLNHGSMSL